MAAINLIMSGSVIPASALEVRSGALQTPEIYYVALNGNDSNPGTLAEPLKTVTKAVSLAQPGTVIYLRGGDYAENIVINKSGTSVAPIALRPYQSEAVSITGGTGHVIRDSGGQSYWVIEGLRLVTTGSSSVAIMMTSANWGGSVTSNWTVQNNVLEGGGILIRGNNHVVRNNNIDGQRLAKSGDDWRSGIREFTSVSHHNLYENNFIKGFYRSGIWSMSYTHDSRFIGNTITDIYGTGDAGQCLNLDGAGTVEYRHVVAWNDISKCGSEGIQFENVFDSLMENNYVHDTYRGITVTNYTVSVGCGLQDGYGDSNGDGACRDEVSNTIVRQNLVVNASGGAFTNYGADGYYYLLNSAYGGWSVLNFTKPDVQTRTDVVGNIISNAMPTQLRANSNNLHPNFAYVNAPTSYLPSLDARDKVSFQPYTNSVTGGWTLDYAGLPRLVGSAYDIGAFEYQAATPPTNTPTATASGTPPSMTSTQTTIVETATIIPAETPSATITPLPTSTTAPTGQTVITSASPKTLLVGETSLVSVNMVDIPAGGYVSVEFTCTFAPDQIKAENIQIATLFGNDPVSAFQDHQNGGFILAIAGSNGNKALTDGLAFTFTASGLKTGQSIIECTALVSSGDNSLVSILSIPDTLTVLDNSPTTTPDLPPTITGQVNASKPVTVSLLNSDSSIAAATIANSDGTFLLTARPGGYIIIASAEGFLDAQGIVTLANGVTNVMPTITLPAGDIDGNDVIDQYDALTLGMNYNLSGPALSDLSNDDTTNIYDLEMLAVNYRKAGALSWQ